MISEKIQALIIERTDFVNEELETAVEKVFSSVTSLVTAGAAFDKSASGGPDETAVAEAIMDFATHVSSSKLTPDTKEQLKTLFKGFYRGIDEAQTALGVQIFSATFDLDSRTTALNELADTLLQTPPPPVEEV